MKPSFFVLLWLLLGCGQRTPEPIDALTQTAWCNGPMSYRFGSDGSFARRANAGVVTGRTPRPAPTWK